MMSMPACCYSHWQAKKLKVAFDGKTIVCCKYVGYYYNTNTNVFTIISNIKWGALHLSSAMITKVNSFGYAIYSSADAHC